MIAALKLVAFVARFVLVYAGVVILVDRAEGGFEVRSLGRRGTVLYPYMKCRVFFCLMCARLVYRVSAIHKTVPVVIPHIVCLPFRG